MAGSFLRTCCFQSLHKAPLKVWHFMGSSIALGPDKTGQPPDVNRLVAVTRTLHRLCLPMLAAAVCFIRWLFAEFNLVEY